MIAISIFIAATADVASASEYDLKNPFRPGDVYIYGDENYFNGDEHPTSGAIAFDMIDDPWNGPSPVYAMGTGEARLVCTHVSGASVVSHKVDGYDGGVIRLVHLQASSHPDWLTSEWSDVEQGQFLGNVFPDAITPRNGDSCWQFSSGRHLHLDLPQAETIIDGEVWSSASPNIRDTVTSTNVEYVPTTPTTTTTAAPTTTTAAPTATSTTTTTAPTTTTPPTTTTAAPKPAAVMCGGHEATIIGTPGNDRLTGTNGRDVIAGLQGDDIIHGLDGDDVICGGTGNDILIGGQGFDVLYGAQGNDTLIAADGESASQQADSAGSRMYGGADDDRIIGSARWDRMQGGSGNDQMFGYHGRDWMRGGAGADTLDGGPNGDDLHGGNGTDRIIATTGDKIRGGSSKRDRCDLNGSTPAVMISCERVFL